MLSHIVKFLLQRKKVHRTNIKIEISLIVHSPYYSMGGGVSIIIAFVGRVGLTVVVY